MRNRFSDPGRMNEENLMQAVSTSKKIDFNDSWNFSGKLDELREAVQCIRTWYVVLRCGDLSFMYGKCRLCASTTVVGKRWCLH